MIKTLNTKNTNGIPIARVKNKFFCFSLLTSNPIIKNRINGSIVHNIDNRVNFYCFFFTSSLIWDSGSALGYLSATFNKINSRGCNTNNPYIAPFLVPVEFAGSFHTK